MRNRLLLFPLLILISCASHHQPSPEELLSLRIQEYFRRSEAFGFSGSLLVAKNNEVILQRGYGLADRAQNVPVTSATVFSIESIAKPITAAAILKLQHAGKLKVTDRIDQYFHDAPADKSSITIQQLLSHTAGLADDYAEDPAENMEHAVAGILATPLIAKPGEKFEYSDSGYNLLAAIIQVASGETFESYVRREIFQAAGMNSAGFKGEGMRWPAAHVAHSYNREKDYGSPAEWPHSWGDRGAGDIVSSTMDLYRFGQYVASTPVLAAAREPQAAVREKWSYGYGWFIVQTDRSSRMFYHGGNITPAGFTAEYREYPDEGVVTVLLVNEMMNEDGLNRAVRDDLEAMLFGGEEHLPPDFLEPNVANQERFVGSYSTADSAKLNVRSEDGKILLDGAPEDSFPRVYLTGNSDCFVGYDLLTRLKADLCFSENSLTLSSEKSTLRAQKP